MRALSVPELLAVWEQGLTQTPVERALSLFSAACPDAAPNELARLPIGWRDGQLLTLREWTFGPALTSLAACPVCNERVELAFETSDIRAETEAESEKPLLLNVAEHELALRLPNSEDLMAIANEESAASNPATARTLLLARCILQARRGDAGVTIEDLPAEVGVAAARAMAEADPQADVQLALACPNCGHEWQANFDIVAYFWAEINGWAVRLLREVHALAAAYGWREADILALSPLRRQLYLEMLSQ